MSERPDGLRVQIRSTSLSWREVDGEVIALDLASSTYFTTNKTGTILWHAMVDGAYVEDLVDLLQQEFAIGREVAETDVRSFVSLLAENGLLLSEG